MGCDGWVSPTGSGATGSIHTRGTERTLNTSSSAARTTREARRAPEVSRAPLTAEVGGARPTRAVLPEAERDGLADAFARRVADVSIVACMVQIGTRVPGVVWQTGTRRVRLFVPGEQKYYDGGSTRASEDATARRARLPTSKLLTQVHHASKESNSLCRCGSSPPPPPEAPPPPAFVPAGRCANLVQGSTDVTSLPTPRCAHGSSTMDLLT